MNNYSRIMIALGLCLIAASFTHAVWKKEQVLEQGQQMLIKLAPVDPRSLMQGDYMVLRYDVPSALRKLAQSELNGQFVYELDEQNVASFKRLMNDDEELSSEEKRIDFRYRKSMVQLAANSFFFQEGKAKIFEKAEYGELRVDESGKAVLVGLRDENLQLLGLSSGL